MFFQTLSVEQQDTKPDVSIEIACAVLLCEVMKADGLITQDEHQHVADALSKHFSLSAPEVEEIIEQAINLSENATDFYQFTSQLNQHYTTEAKMQIVTMLWHLAYIDGELASIEAHVIRKIADLLHLRHNEYIDCKISAQQAFGEHS